MSFIWRNQISTAWITGYATRSYFLRLKLSFGSISKSKVMFSFEIIGTSSIIKILKIKFRTLQRTFVQFLFFKFFWGILSKFYRRPTYVTSDQTRKASPKNTDNLVISFPRFTNEPILSSRFWRTKNWNCCCRWCKSDYTYSERLRVTTTPEVKSIVIYHELEKLNLLLKYHSFW